MSLVPIDQLTAARFEELKLEGFEAHSGSGAAVALRIFSVAKPQSIAAGYESFSVIFDGPQNPPLNQGIYRMHCAKLGLFDLFIVPIGADRGLRQYEAVFNRASEKRS